MRGRAQNDKGTYDLFADDSQSIESAFLEKRTPFGHTGYQVSDECRPLLVAKLDHSDLGNHLGGSKPCFVVGNRETLN